jgi:hypothetical protein
MSHAAILEPRQLTLEAWIRPQAWPTGDDPCTWIVCKNSNELTDGNYALAMSHNNIGAYLNIGGGREGCFSAWSMNGPLLLNQWHHVAMTYDDVMLKVYCDGTIRAATTVNRPRTTGKGLLRIGKRADNRYPSFNGLVDEVRLYARALTVEEIQKRFENPTSTAAAPEQNLAHSWSFEELYVATESIKANAGPLEPYRSRFQPANQKKNATSGK